MAEQRIASIRAPIAAIFLFKVCALIARSYVQTELTDAGYDARQAADLSYLFMIPIIGILLWPILNGNSRFLLEQLNARRMTWRLFGSALLLGVLLRLAYWSQLLGLVAAGVYRDGDLHPVETPFLTFACPPAQSILLYLAAMAVAVPLIEETINRGLILPTLLRRGSLPAIVISSALFAVLHPPAAMINAFVIGLFFASITLRTGFLWPAIFAHATYNGLIALDWICLRGSWNPATSAPVQYWVAGLSLLVYVSSLLGAIKLTGKRMSG